MEEGFILDKTYGANLVAHWVAGPPESSFWQGTVTSGKEMRKILSYRCPKCGYLESYAKEFDS